MNSNLKVGNFITFERKENTEKDKVKKGGRIESLYHQIFYANSPSSHFFVLASYQEFRS
jgi:hypothetical protein